jgi:predicted GNAT family acetyltransferase
MSENAYKLVIKSSINKVLFETEEARLVEIFDSSGNLCGILIRVMDGALWQVSVKGDADFDAFAKSHGYKTASSRVPI